MLVDFSLSLCMDPIRIDSVIAHVCVCTREYVCLFGGVFFWGGLNTKIRNILFHEFESAFCFASALSRPGIHSKMGCYP